MAFLTSPEMAKAARLSPNTLDAVLRGPKAFALRPPSRVTEGGHRRWCRRDVIHVAVAAAATTTLRLPLPVGLRLARGFVHRGEALRLTGIDADPVISIPHEPFALCQDGATFLVAYDVKLAFVVERPHGIALDLEAIREAAKGSTDPGDAALIIEMEPIVRRVDAAFVKSGAPE